VLAGVQTLGLLLRGDPQAHRGSQSPRDRIAGREGECRGREHADALAGDLGEATTEQQALVHDVRVDGSSGETKPAAGVIATRPATAPDAAPSVVALPVIRFSSNSQPTRPPAASWSKASEYPTTHVTVTIAIVAKFCMIMPRACFDRTIPA